MADTVPIARLEKLWRRLRRRAAAHEGLTHGSARRYYWGMHNADEDAAADLRALIDEAKGETDE